MPKIEARERGFVGTGLTLLCRLAGMSVRSIWGVTAAAWKRRRLDPDEMEMMLVAEKTGNGIDPRKNRIHDRR